MDRTERTISSACGMIRLDGLTVPMTVRDSIRRCLNDEGIFDFAVTYIAGARANYRSMHKLERSETDPYCYAGTNTLVNKLNIRDEEVLTKKIRDIVPIRIAELEMHPITSPIGTDYLRKLHRALYGDVFSWAGEFRTTECDDACRPMFIESYLKGLFDGLKKDDYLSGSEDFTKYLAHYYSELSAVRPFRYGNGVCIRVLMNIIAIMNGRYLDYSKASESLMDIAVRRGIAGDLEQLKEMMDGIIEDY